MHFLGYRYGSVMEYVVEGGEHWRCRKGIILLAEICSCRLVNKQVVVVTMAPLPSVSASIISSQLFPNALALLHTCTTLLALILNSITPYTVP